MLKSNDVARYFLALQDTEETGELISNLKIQKLCYYAQGFALAVLERPIFEEHIERWQHGPLIPSLWQDYRFYGSGPIPQPVDLDLELYSPEEKTLLDDVFRLYGQFSAWKLRNMTHVEPPWVNTPERDVITHGRLKEYFETLVEDDGEAPKKP